MSGIRSRDQADVIVIGGGPGGAAAATLLQRQGHRCVIVERSRFPRYRIGESLIPHTFGPLSRLGLIPRLEASHFPPKHSVRFVSVDGAESEPFYFSETIDSEAARTWQVERAEFDQMCLDHAVENGVEVRQNACVTQVLFEEDLATGVRVSTGDGTFDMASRVVVDASGRATVIGRQLELRESIPWLQKASVWSYFRGGKRGDGIDAGETTIFLLQNRGWAWYIPLPDDTVSVGVVAAPDDLFPAESTAEAAFIRAVSGSAALSARLASAERTAGVRGGSAHLAYRNRETCGPGWVMVGDARAFLDPIYSSGVFLALASAEAAAGCIHEALDAGDVSPSKLGAFEPGLNAGGSVIAALIRAFYCESFSFRTFLSHHPGQRAALIDCLVGDVFDKDMGAFVSALESTSQP